MSDSELDASEAVRAVMRTRQHLAGHSPHGSHAVQLPPLGSPERARLEAEIARELGEALARSGLSVLDLIERR